MNIARSLVPKPSAEGKGLLIRDFELYFEMPTEKELNLASGLLTTFGRKLSVLVSKTLEVDHMEVILSTLTRRTKL